MTIDYGGGTTEYGPGVAIELTGDEIAVAIHAYLVAHQIHVTGPSTVRVNGRLCEDGRVYVDPLGQVVAAGVRFSGRGQSWEKI